MTTETIGYIVFVLGAVGMILPLLYLIRSGDCP